MKNEQKKCWLGFEKKKNIGWADDKNAKSLYIATIALFVMLLRNKTKVGNV